MTSIPSSRTSSGTTLDTFINHSAINASTISNTSRSWKCMGLTYLNQFQNQECGLRRKLQFQQEITPFDTRNQIDSSVEQRALV